MLKRSYSDSEGEDGFSDGNMDKHPESECHMMNRKKRRGIIEKRRRDRINNSLAELRRLVPTAFEKQGSAKLEKAEILQMTVDHLKMLHAKGLDALTYDPHKVAMDYHSLGFRECAAEVARYLVTVEGMDIQDPLRLRLMSHLQCFSAQRDLAAKQASSWGFPSAPNSTYPAPPPSQPTHVGLPAHIMGSGNQVMGNLDNPGSHSMSAFTPSQSGLGMSMLNDPSSSSSCPNSSMGRLVYSTATTGVTGISPSPQTASNSGQYHVNFNTHSFTGMGPAMGTQGSGYNSPGSQVKPYRPWGAELAY